MPNSNYISGRAFEYEVMKAWKERGYSCVRASGSHGLYDVVAFRPDRKPELIQCKVTRSKKAAEKLIDTFQKSTKTSVYYHQTLSVKIKSDSIISRTV